MPYFVAFEHNQGHSKGIRFWTMYPNKEAFEESQLKTTHNAHTVVAQGENEEEIRRIALSYDPALLITSAEAEVTERLEQAIESGSPEDIDNTLEWGRMKLFSAALAATLK